MIIAGILAGAMLGLYYGVVRSFADTGNRMVNQDDARTAINQMARYIRMATSSASNQTSVSDAIALAQPQELVFYADINGNGQPDKVRYYLSGLHHEDGHRRSEHDHEPAQLPGVHDRRRRRHERDTERGHGGIHLLPDKPAYTSTNPIPRTRQLDGDHKPDERIRPGQDRRRGGDSLRERSPAN